jgi:ATP-dependent Clp protease ATP-binding subunit ClpB
MTDGHGRTVDFKNTIIIMTSNVGSRWIQEQIGDIVDIQMKRLKSRLAEMNMDLVLSEDARAFLAERDLTRYTVPVQ